MKTRAGHLTYCTNIHPGEDWNSHFQELRTYLPAIKSKISPSEKMGLGLRVSNQMSLDLGNRNTLKEFQEWLGDHQMYVFIINGFPYGQFHDTVIKDQVHTPDWTTSDRVEYTKRLIDILAKILPEDMKTGGISTPPLSYRHWFMDAEQTNEAIETATRNIMLVLEYLHHLHLATGQIIHLDIEPEPDGLLENGQEFIHWYKAILIPMAHEQLKYKGLDETEVNSIVRRHIRLCYDVCHMAVEFENQRELTERLDHLNIPIGRIQLSSALRLPPSGNPAILKTFDESQYLHQVVIRKPTGILEKYKDLGPALEKETDNSPGNEWRIHFHVPLFTQVYGELHSTRDYIDEILDIHRQKPLSDFLEIETYTWDVLPDTLQRPMGESIVREFAYIGDIIQKQSVHHE